MTIDKCAAFVFITSILAVAWLLPALVTPVAASTLLKEDGVYENFSCLLLFLSAIFFFLTFLGTRDRGSRSWFLALAALMFFGAGEEISWGQRIFDWEVSEHSTNIQGETTIHNLPIFDTVHGGILKMSRLFMISCVVWGVVLPLLYMTIPKVRHLIGRVRLPIVPLALGALFLVNIVASKIYQFAVVAPYIERIAEAREATQALMLVCISLYFFMKARPSSRSTASPDDVVLADRDLDNSSIAR